jgi:hypothetical protein
MFEIILQRILAALGASDQLIATMGPSLAILLAIAGGTAVAQYFKYPISRRVRDEAGFDFWVRTVAVLSTFVLAVLLSHSVPWPLALVFAFLQLAIYHLSLRTIRRWWPWMEAHKAVGAIDPPPAAFLAKAQREADKRMDDGQDSGA